MKDLDYFSIEPNFEIDPIEYEEEYSKGRLKQIAEEVEYIENVVYPEQELVKKLRQAWRGWRKDNVSETR